MYNFAEIQNNYKIRTKFKCPHNHKTTGNAGDLIPIFVKEVLPNDTIKVNMDSLVKMTTPNFQTMDQAFMDVAFYFVPNRLVWSHWKAFQGEKTVGPHETQPEYTIPQVTAPEGGWHENTIADYFGIPTKVSNISVNALPFRAYCLIWNEWYRDQNRKDFTDFNNEDATIAGSNGDNYVTDPIKGGKCLKVAKIHDYFTSTLLTPTGSQEVVLPIGNIAPVNSYKDMTHEVKGWDAAVTNLSSGGQDGNFLALGQGETKVTTRHLGQEGSYVNYFVPNNLWADLSEATATTVNQLRRAFQLQKIFEANNRSGSRYVEILRNRWGVTPSDARLQRPEYLGGKRIPLSINMVVQTSATNETSPLGNIAGFSNTHDSSNYFTKNFEEHGYIIGLAYIRHNRTYQQGTHKMWSRRTMEDFYMPEFANIGEQAVLNKEIFTSGNNSQDNEVFGYQEYGAEYRYMTNRISGEFRSNATNSFDNWHYADDYAVLPINSSDWIDENKTSIDRTLTVTSQTVNQFYFDFYFDETDVRNMPTHSIPGLIDHH